MILSSPPPESSPIKGEESFLGELDAPQFCCGVLHLEDILIILSI